MPCLRIAENRYAQCRADRVVATAHWHICLPHVPPRHQSKQKSQSTVGRTNFDKHFLVDISDMEGYKKILGSLPIVNWLTEFIPFLLSYHFRKTHLSRRGINSHNNAFCFGGCCFGAVNPLAVVTLMANR